jgi:glycerophosphoryl diester phosphodiesterase
MDRVQRVDVIAHRGASGVAPENSLEAFDLALEQGADVLELDVRIDGDGEFALVHDATLLRSFGDPRRVDEVGCGAVGVARLDAVFERHGARTRFLVDLKDPAPEWEGRVVEAIVRHGLQQRVVVQSFDVAALSRLRERFPWLPLAPLYRRVASMGLVLDAVPAWAEGFGPWHGAVDAALVERAHARGLAIRPWTVDDPREARRLLALGVDALITNLPGVIAPVVRRSALRLAG